MDCIVEMGIGIMMYVSHTIKIVWKIKKLVGVSKTDMEDIRGIEQHKARINVV
jgi:hypothetical protein